MKIKLVLIGVAALLATVINVTAQEPRSGSYAPITVPFSLSGTATTASNTVYAATNAPTIGALKQRMVAVGANIASGIGGATNVYTFAPSINGIDVNTNDLTEIRTFTVYTKSAVPVYCSTNWDSLGYPFWKVVNILTTGVSTNGVPVTATTARNGLEYAVKISSP